MRPILEIVGSTGIAEVLNLLRGASETSHPRIFLEDQLFEHNVNDPAAALDDLLAAGLLEYFGAQIGISQLGHRTAILIDAINDGDFEAAYQKLRRLSNQEDSYSFVREGMRHQFLKSLVDRPGFSRLYICSPWITPSRRDASYLRQGYRLAERRTGEAPEIFVISRGDKKHRDGLRVFEGLHTRIFFHKRVHAKLYIREPDTRGGGTLWLSWGRRTSPNPTILSLASKFPVMGSSSPSLFATFTD